MTSFCKVWGVTRPRADLGCTGSKADALPIVLLGPVTVSDDALSQESHWFKPGTEVSYIHIHD